MLDSLATMCDVRHVVKPVTALALDYRDMQQVNSVLKLFSKSFVHSKAVRGSGIPGVASALGLCHDLLDPQQ